jgi:hypothetical protein
MSWIDFLSPQKQVGHFPEGQLPPHVSAKPKANIKEPIIANLIPSVI